MRNDPLERIEKTGLLLRKRMLEQFPEASNETLVKETLKLLGGKIVNFGDDEFKDFLGLVYVKSEGDFYIKVGAFDSPLRDNFTIMARIGSYLLHCKTDDFDFIPSMSEVIQANRFAAAFLMPKKLCKKYVKRYNNSICRISLEFDLPTDIVQARLTYVLN